MLSVRRGSLCLYLLLSLVLFTTSQIASATQVYTDITLNYYNHFFRSNNGDWATQNFQRFHVLRQGLRNDKLDVSFNFNLYEKVSGPLADHTITPYTLESSYRLDNGNQVDANLMVLVDVYHKNQPHINAFIEADYCMQKEYGIVKTQVAPGIRVSRAATGQSVSINPTLSASISLPVKSGHLNVGLNTLAPKEQALVYTESPVLTATYQWPTWAGNKMSISANGVLGPVDADQDKFWLSVEVSFDHLFGYEF